MSEKKLGFGMMRLPLTDPNESASIDLELTKKMVDAYLERGFTYFDTAYMYCGGKSECAVKEVLTDRYPRDRFTVTSKLPPNQLNTEADRDRVFYEQLEKTGLGWFDYYFLHSITAKNIETFEGLGCFDWIRQKKEKGLAKQIGFSFHAGPELLDRILTDYPFFDVVQLQINYLDWESPKVQSRACYEVAVKHNKQVIIMEPVKGGTLADVPESVKRMFEKREKNMSAASWAIRFAASLQNVKVVLSGMSNMEQLLDNTGYMADFKPLNEEEKKMVLLAGDIISGNIPFACTGCEYCTANCPADIPIPQYFALYNDTARTGAVDSQTYEKLSNEFGAASECAQCGQCENICPQSLPIRDYLKQVAQKFE